MHNDLHNNDTILISFSLLSCAASYLSKFKEMAVLSFDLRELCYIPDITHVIDSCNRIETISVSTFVYPPSIRRFLWAALSLSTI